MVSEELEKNVFAVDSELATPEAIRKLGPKSPKVRCIYVWMGFHKRELAIHNALLHHAGVNNWGEGGKLFVTIETLMRESGYRDRAGVIAGIQTLESTGLWSHYSKGAHNVNHYVLHPERLCVLERDRACGNPPPKIARVLTASERRGLKKAVTKASREEASTSVESPHYSDSTIDSATSVELPLPLVGNSRVTSVESPPPLVGKTRVTSVESPHPNLKANLKANLDFKNLDEPRAKTDGGFEKIPGADQGAGNAADGPEPGASLTFVSDDDKIIFDDKIKCDEGEEAGIEPEPVEPAVPPKPPSAEAIAALQAAVDAAHAHARANSIGAFETPLTRAQGAAIGDLREDRQPESRLPQRSRTKNSMTMPPYAPMVDNRKTCLSAGCGSRKWVRDGFCEAHRQELPDPIETSDGEVGVGENHPGFGITLGGWAGVAATWNAYRDSMPESVSIVA